MATYLRKAETWRIAAAVIAVALLTVFRYLFH